jgi:hypothetical protein
MQFKKFSALFKRPPQRTIVSFTGGMGAQIISAAIYYMLREQGQRVRCDLRYFDQESHLAVAGNAGDCSLWPWQLDCFGISLADFETEPSIQGAKNERIDDGALKLRLGIQALQLPQVQARFRVPERSDDLLPAGFPEKYLCIHIRRGDYVNVASHLVADAQFIDMARNFAAILSDAVIVSDSPIPPSFRARIEQLFPRVVYMVNVDAYISHRLMRTARVLIGSNSQFSLIAALLNTQGMIVLPRQWFGKGEEDLENVVRDVCDFQILNRPESASQTLV